MESKTITINMGSWFTGLLAIVFITLKLMNIINWPWIWVLAPIWIPVALVLIILLILFVIKGIGVAINKRKRHHKDAFPR